MEIQAKQDLKIEQTRSACSASRMRMPSLSLYNNLDKNLDKNLINNLGDKSQGDKSQGDKSQGDKSQDDKSHSPKTKTSFVPMMGQDITRLYEQQASSASLGEYFKHWLGWSKKGVDNLVNLIIFNGDINRNIKRKLKFNIKPSPLT